MNVRRSAATLAASAVLCVGAAPVALADVAPPSPPPPIPSGLFGKNDPTYDGVWRQSFALLAQHAVGLKPNQQAIDWLAGQQCADGGFASFRADTGAACDAKTLDTNATAVAVQALEALGGQDAVVKKAKDWLKSVQNDDGGWAYLPGSPSEASSTAVVISALAVAGEKPADVTSKLGKSAYDSLLTFQLGCSAEPAEDRGAFAYQRTADGKLPANADATAAAVLAGLGKGTAVTPPATDTLAASLTCPATAGDAAAAAAQGAAGYLAKALNKDGNHLTALTPGADQPTSDIGNTADAVISLAAAGHKQSAASALEWLKANSAEWSKGSPAGLGTLILAAHAMGTDPKDFGGTNLVAALNATGPAPASASEQPAKKKDEKKDSGNKNVWWMILAGAAAGMGIGIVLSGRRKKNQL